MKATTSGWALATSSQLTARDGAPGTLSTGSPPAATTMSGTQWPPQNGGSDHSRASVRGRGWSATAARDRVDAARNPSMSTRACSAVPVASPTVPMLSMTSSRVDGSRESTLAWQPKTASASCTGARRDGADPTEILREDEIGWMASTSAASRV